MSKETGRRIVDLLFKMYEEDKAEAIINKSTKAIILDFIGGEPLMNITAGTVVISRAGHDCGRAMLVVRNDGEFLFVADGKERKLDKPKKKNKKHKD